MKFQNTKFWKNYKLFDKIVKESSMRSTVDAVLYWKLLSNFTFPNMLEIGVYQGLTSSLLLELQPDSKLTAIDPRNRLEIFNNLYKDDLAKRFNFIQCESQSADIDEYFDFILIDGDHSFDGTYSDMLKFIPKLQRTGVLAIDDYKLPGVDKAISKLIASNIGMVPFLQLEQTEFWHYPENNRSVFLDSLLEDTITKFIFLYNINRFNSDVLKAKTLDALTSNIKIFDIILKEYDV